MIWVAVAIGAHALVQLYAARVRVATLQVLVDTANRLLGELRRHRGGA